MATISDRVYWEAWPDSNSKLNESSIDHEPSWSFVVGTGSLAGLIEAILVQMPFVFCSRKTVSPVWFRIVTGTVKIETFTQTTSGGPRSDPPQPRITKRNAKRASMKAICTLRRRNTMTSSPLVRGFVAYI